MNEKVAKSSLGRKLAIILVIVGLSGAAFGILLSYPRGSVTGEIHSTGMPHGDFVVRPVTCFSGGHWGFTGVWVVSETLTSGSKRGFKGGLKIMKNDAGAWETYVENPNICQGFKCQLKKVDPRYCNVFNVVVEDMSIWMRYDGLAQINCTFPDGGTLKTDLSFKGCAKVHAGGSAEADL